MCSWLSEYVNEDCLKNNAFCNIIYNLTKQLIDEKLNKIYHIIRMKKATYFILFAIVNENRGIMSHIHDKLDKMQWQSLPE